MSRAWLGALGCVALAFAVGAPPRASATPQADDSVLKRLADADEKVRRGAVGDLGRQGGVDAFTRVLRALSDPSAMVADEAQLALRAIDEEEELELLLSKDGLGSKDALVRLRCAEALGRVSAPVSAARLVKPIADKDASVRRTLVAAIERRTRSGGFREPDPAEWDKVLRGLMTRDSDGGVRAAAAMAVDARKPGLDAAALAGLAADEHFEARSAALLAGADRDAAAQLAAIAIAITDAHPSVRLQAVHACAKLGDKAAVQALARALADEASARNAWTIVAHLRRLSGLKFGRDVRPWNDWASSLADDWRPGAPSKVDDDGARSASIVGLNVAADRFTLLVDLSGSMWEERDGQTRKAGADRELERALTALAPAVEFNVIPFTLTPIPWQAKLMPATPKNVAAALAFFQKRADRGKGNYWDAMQLALEDPRCESLVVLGDGAPSGGTRWNLGLMRELFEEQNRFRLVGLDAVLVDCPKGLSRIWTEWCEGTGGRAHAAELR